eukprot:3711065-Amphidinium_carterae.3
MAGAAAVTPPTEVSNKAIDSLWKSDSSILKAPRKRKDISIAQQVKNALRDSLWMLTDNEIDCVLDPTTSLTCRQRLTRDKTAIAEGRSKEPMGKLYYATLRSIYQTSTSIEKQLQLQPGQQVTEGFKQAFIACISHPPRRSELRSWLNCQQAASVSKEDLQGLCNVLHRQRIPSTQEVFGLCMAIVEGLARLDASRKIPVPMGLIKQKVNEVLVQASNKTH